MKKIIIGLIALGALAGVILLLSGKGEEAPKNSEVKIEDKIYVAVEEAGEIAVISAKDRVVIKRIDLSADIGGVKIGFMPHNVQVAPDNKSVWVTANAMDMSNDKVSFFKISRVQADEGHGEEAGMMPNDEVIVIDPLMDKIIKRIEIGTDLHLSHVALTPDSNTPLRLPKPKALSTKSTPKLTKLKWKQLPKKAANRTA